MGFKPGQSGNPQGKPRGALSRRTQQAIDVMVAHDVDPIQALCLEYRSLKDSRLKATVKDRIGILQALLPYAYPPACLA